MNTSKLKRYSLRQYTRLIIAFFGALAMLAVYQYVVLYLKGIIDNLFGGSFFIALAHQLGFASLVALVLLVPFNFLENLRSRRGYYFVFLTLSIVLALETSLITYYTTTMVLMESTDQIPMGIAFFNVFKDHVWTFLQAILLTALAIALFFWLYGFTSRYYKYVLSMYPFTIILFSLFVSTFFLDGKPINQNKTQYLVSNLIRTSSLEENEAGGKLHFAVKNDGAQFTDGEKIWINSLYNGHNLDKYFLIARELAFEGKYDKARLLCHYILLNESQYVDAQILKGRTYAWQADYPKAISALEKAITMNVNYKDSYAALLDVYFWSNTNEKAKALQQRMLDHDVYDALLAKKVSRCKKALLKDALAESNQNNDR